MGTNWKELLSHRVLVRDLLIRHGSATEVAAYTLPIEELFVTEVTPLGYVKLESTAHGMATWKHPSDLALVEDLGLDPRV